MKTLFRSCVLVCGLVVLAGVHNASGQIDNALEFTTSFPFVVGNTTLPAGSYTITPADEDPQILALRGEGTEVFVATESAQPNQVSSKDEVVFKQYGDRYVLKNIWPAGSTIGYVTENALGEQRTAKSSGATSESRVTAQKAASSPK